MLYYVWLLSILLSLCNAAALPQLREKHLNPRLADSRISEHRLANKYPRRSGQDCGVSVSLELLDSGYIGNISIGSQGQSVPTLFDLNASQLSALSPTVQYCSGSDDCTPRNNHFNSYNPSLSHSSKNLSTTFEVIVSNATFTGVLYQDSISIGGVSIPKQSFGLTREIRGHSSTGHQFSGVAGLSGCNRDDNGFGSTPSFLQSLSTGGHIKSPGFSLWMNPATSSGELLLGAVDASKYTSPLYLFDLVNPSSWYSVYLSKISSSTGSTTGLSQIETVFDTTTDSIVLPRSWGSSLKTVFDGDLDQNSTLLVPCAATTEQVDIVFFLGNGIPISIPLSAFVGEPTGTDGMCLSPILFTDTEQYVLGTSFLRYVYLVLNSDGSQGAVAQASFVENNSDSDLTSMSSETPLPFAISFTSPINESNTTSISNITSTDVGNGTAFNAQSAPLATTEQLTTEAIVTTVTSQGTTSVFITVVTLTLDDSTSISQTTNSAATTSIQLVTETFVTTVSSGSSISAFTTTVTSTISSAITATTDPVASGSVTTPVVDAVSTTSTSNLTTTGTATLPNFVVSLSASTDSSSSQTTTTATTGSNSFTFDEVLASATSTSTAPPSNFTTTLISSTDTTSNPIVNHVVSATTTDPVKDGLVISYGTYSPSTSVSGQSIATGPSIHGFNVPYTSTPPPSQSYPTPWPSGPININIFIQNSIVLTTTRNYAPDDSKDVLTVTSTATVTTTVPCSTDPGTWDTLTARVLQILIVPSPTPYVDPECTCTKSDITYVDDNVTKTIYVDDTTASLEPTQRPYPTSEPPACECDDCYYTVKKTATVTMTCTAAPAPTSAAPVPVWVSGASTMLPAMKLVSILVLAMTLALFR